MTDNITASPTTSDGNYPRAGGTIAWSNASNIYSANSTYASVTVGGEEKSKYLRAGGFALSALPDDAIIRGLVVSIRRYASAASTIKEAAVTLVKEDWQGFNNEGTGAYVGTSLTTVSYGGSTELWGENFPVATQYKAANFGVLVGYNNDEIGADVGAMVFVDHVEVTIYYDAPPDCSGVDEVSAWAGNASAAGGWTNDSNAAGPPDTAYAYRQVSIGTGRVYITLSNFDLDTIPSGAEILGVRLTIVAKITGSCQKWHYIQPRDGSTNIARGKFPFVEPTGGSQQYIEYGNCEDFWETTEEPPNQFTPAMFNNQTIVFGISLENLGSSGDAIAEINAVQLTVWYQE
ncbi:MAG: hypothetical protein ACKVW3_17905 [Phycisphaerales bacterium]